MTEIEELKIQLADAIIDNEHRNVINEFIENIQELEKQLK